MILDCPGKPVAAIAYVPFSVADVAAEGKPKPCSKDLVTHESHDSHLKLRGDLAEFGSSLSPLVQYPCRTSTPRVMRGKLSAGLPVDPL